MYYRNVIPRALTTLQEFIWLATYEHTGVWLVRARDIDIFLFQPFFFVDPTNVTFFHQIGNTVFYLSKYLSLPKIENVNFVRWIKRKNCFCIRFRTFCNFWDKKHNMVTFLSRGGREIKLLIKYEKPWRNIHTINSY